MIGQRDAAVAEVERAGFEDDLPRIVGGRRAGQHRGDRRVEGGAVRGRSVVGVDDDGLRRPRRQRARRAPTGPHAEVDLDLRGEGTLISTSQKGRSDLKLASLRRDRELVELAREAAFEIVDADPDLARHPVLHDELDLLFTEEDEGFLTKS